MDITKQNKSPPEQPSIDDEPVRPTDQVKKLTGALMHVLHAQAELRALDDGFPSDKLHLYNLSKRLGIVAEDIEEAIELSKGPGPAPDPMMT